MKSISSDDYACLRRRIDAHRIVHPCVVRLRFAVPSLPVRIANRTSIRPAYVGLGELPKRVESARGRRTGERVFFASPRSKARAEPGGRRP